jgi:hypothetical protein
MESSQLDSIIRLGEAIDKFGSLVIGMAAFIFIGIVAVFFIFRRLKKVDTDKDTDFSKMFSEMQSQNQQVFTQLMQTAFNNSHQPELVPDSITATTAVQEQLKHVAAVTKADRIAVYAFHNGQRMMNGRHMIKFSCWAEFVMLNKFVRIDKHKDIQVSRIQEICNSLLKEHHWEALTEEAIKESQMDLWNELTDIQSAFAQAIYSADGVILGFILIEYILSPVEPTWIEKVQEEIKKLSDKVSLVLDIELK